MGIDHKWKIEHETKTIWQIGRLLKDTLHVGNLVSNARQFQLISNALKQPIWE